MTRRDLLKSGIVLPVALAAQSTTGPAPTGGSLAPREHLLLDFGWRFHLGNADDPAKDFGFGANGETFAKTGTLAAPGKREFDDSAWTKIDLPHDWAVELPFVNERNLISHGCKPLGRAHPETSIGWYRKTFELPASDKGRRISLEFDGVYRDSVVIFNNTYLGRNMSGYAPVRYDVTDFANYGSVNTVVVRVDATLSEGWFYEGAGIYRHVWLTKTDPLHVAPHGTFVRSDVREGEATVFITTDLRNESGEERRCRVSSAIVDASGNAIAAAHAESGRLDPWVRQSFEQKVNVRNPGLWSVEEPRVYKLLTTVEGDGGVVDRYETTFGIRSIRYDADQGFFLNGKHVEMKGTCNHQDHAGVGAALPDRTQYYRVERLKDMGSNAYRTSHNPPTPELLDACDRLGMLVMDETRMFSSSPEGLSQIERMVLRDRNHPCVVIWSIGNEEPLQGTEEGARIAETMKRLVARLDPTRPITEAMNSGYRGKGLNNVVDVQGFNYNMKEIDPYHAAHPRQPMVGTETASTVSTRGIYANDKQKGYVSAYDVNYPGWADTAESWWKLYAQRAFLAGGYAWTGFDYRGEPTPYGWPCISSHFGIMDTCGYPKDNFYYYKAWWGSEPVLHLFPHWNWPAREGEEIDVWCHTNLDRVELFVNGQSAGAQDVARNSHAAWKVKYAVGLIEARGYKDGQVVLTAKRETTGAPASIVLRPDRQRIAADGEDVSLVAVEVVDSKGRIVSTAGNLVTFAVSGNGRLIGVGNGDPSCHEPDHGSKRSAFNGLCMAIVQASKQEGELKLVAISPGLKGGAVTITCEPATPRATA